MTRKDFLKKKTHYKILVFGVIVVFFFIFRNVDDANTFVLTEDGFSPAGTTISLGETVTFVNKTKNAFWPASDFHPSHTLYSDFDPRQGIEAGEKWSFKFEREGLFRFHDHLNPLFRGTVEVKSKSFFSKKSVSQEEAIKICSSKEEREGFINCWKEYFGNLLLDKNFIAAFRSLTEVRNKDARFAADCHTISHSLGESSYWIFDENKKLPLDPIIATCGYGFHHGFMQEFGHHSPYFLRDVKELCNEFANLDYSNYEGTVDPYDQCYHGVGHGIIFFLMADNWEIMDDIVDSGTKACKKMTEDSTYRSNCIYGLFGGVTSLYTGAHGYKVELGDDPLSLCRNQGEETKEACFDSMVPALWVESGFDVFKTLDFFEKGGEKNFLSAAMYNFGDILSPRYVSGEIDSGKVLSACNAIDVSLQSSCIKGFSEGLIRNGVPQDAGKKALAFCDGLALGDIRDLCFTSFLSEMKISNYNDQISEICSKELLKNYCDEENI